MTSANPANFLRTIKLRSVVDAEYKTSYNRLSFLVDPDDFCTDLSQSYLALRMYLCHADGSKFTRADFATLDAQNIYISFGQGDMAYSPLCLIKTARLFAQANYGTPLEECNFANTLTQSLFQLLNDFESVGSSSLTDNNSIVFGHPQSQSSMFATLLEDYVGNGESQLPIEVHLKLSDLFGVFKSNCFYLNDPAIQGLRIDLELEDLKPLFRSQVISEHQNCPAPLVAVDSTTAGLIPTLAENPITSLTAQNNIGQMTCVSAPGGNPIIPDNTSDTGGVAKIAKTSNILQSTQWTGPFFALDDPTPVNTLALVDLWTNPELTSFGLVTGASVRLNFQLKAIGGLANLRQSEIFSRLDIIDTVATVGGHTVITFTESYQQIVSTQWLADLVSLEVVDSFLLAAIPSGSASTLWSDGQITMTQGGVADLQAAGLIGSVAGLTAGMSVPVCPAKFTLHAQTVGTDTSGPTLIPVQPWFDTWISPDVGTSRQLVSNRCLAMPIQGTTTQLVSAVVAGNGTSLILTFRQLGMVNDNSLAPAILYTFTPDTSLPTPLTTGQNTGEGGGHTAAISYNFWISDYNALPAGTTPRLPEEAYTYLIDKSELVLVQSAKQPGVPMSRVYTTNRVEVTTIQSAVPIYNYQFVVPEENVFNIMLLTPQYNADTTNGYTQSLVSWRRGVTEYRWSVNQTDQTNRNLEVGTNTSYYPSSLYLESLMDVLGNANKGMMSLAGPLTIPHSDNPVVAFPLRVYKSNDGVNYIFHPQGFVAQITLYSDTAHDGNIVPGNIFFWKQMLRTL